MSDFFEFPRPSGEPRRAWPELPPWMSAPRAWLPGVVPVELLLARSERAVAAITWIGAYPVGFSFELIVLADDPEQELDPMLDGPTHHPGMPAQHSRDVMLRFGIEFADGAKVTNLGERQGGDRRTPPSSPVLRGAGGHSSGGEWTQRMWAWPLPPPGPLAFVCEWPAAGIELSRVEVEARQLIEAATRAQRIFGRYDDL